MSAPHAHHVRVPPIRATERRIESAQKQIREVNISINISIRYLKPTKQLHVSMILKRMCLSTKGFGELWQRNRFAGVVWENIRSIWVCRWAGLIVVGPNTARLVVVICGPNFGNCTICSSWGHLDLVPAFYHLFWVYFLYLGMNRPETYWGKKLLKIIKIVRYLITSHNLHLLLVNYVVFLNTAVQIKSFPENNVFKRFLCEGEVFVFNSSTPVVKQVGSWPGKEGVLEKHSFSRKKRLFGLTWITRPT